MVDNKKSRSSPYTPSDHYALIQNRDGYQESTEVLKEGHKIYSLTLPEL